MAFQEMQRLPLWEHAAESGRFAEYAVHPTLQPWNLVGRMMLSGITLLGSAVDVAQISSLGRITAGGTSPVATGHVAERRSIACDTSTGDEQALIDDAVRAVRW